ncbi:MAG: FAD:protein FMN transferase [Polyangiaceae bacterium]
MHAFRAMNTDVTVIASGDERAIAIDVADTFLEAERRFSRFLPTSELSALNRAEGPFAASPELFDTLVRARRYVERTDGIFDPAVGGALIDLGYDRSFAPGALDGPLRPRERRRGAVARFLDVGLDVEGRVVTRPPHVRIDLGGMVKGSTVDVAARRLGEVGAIDAGGDAFLRTTAEGDPWLVEIEDPRDASRTVAVVAVMHRGVATSAPNRRRWRAGDAWLHHLVDPRTGESAAGDLLQVTVFARTTEEADVLAKTAFVLGRAAGEAFLRAEDAIGAVLVPKEGALAWVGALDVREVAHA